MPESNGDRTTQEWFMHFDDRFTAAINGKADKSDVVELRQEVKGINKRLNRALGGVTAAWLGLTAWLGIGR